MAREREQKSCSGRGRAREGRLLARVKRLARVTDGGRGKERQRYDNKKKGSKLESQRERADDKRRTIRLLDFGCACRGRDSRSRDGCDKDEDDEDEDSEAVVFVSGVDATLLMKQTSPPQAMHEWRQALSPAFRASLRSSNLWKLRNTFDTNSTVNRPVRAHPCRSLRNVNLKYRSTLLQTHCRDTTNPRQGDFLRSLLKHKRLMGDRWAMTKAQITEQSIVHCPKSQEAAIAINKLNVPKQETLAF